VLRGGPERRAQQGMTVARLALARAGLPVTVPGTTVNRFCSSGLQAIAMAAHQIVHEGVDAAVGGGVESITATAALKQDRKTWANPRVAERAPGIYMVMGETAEVVARRYRVRPEAQDEYALARPQPTPPP